MTVASLEPTTAEPYSEEGRPRRLLLVAYNFPPVGGAGVQRPMKWAKYLRRWGWDVTVLTTLNPSVPVRDESLLDDLPVDVKVVRAHTWEPDYCIKQKLISATTTTKSNLMQKLKGALCGVVRRCAKLALQPDPQVLWIHHAIRAGARILKEQRHDAILVTAPPYSSFFVGSALKRRFGLPLILDYRDEWDLSGKYLENAQRDWVSQFVQGRMQQYLLRRADAVVATTLRSTQALAQKLVGLGHRIPSRCVYNGFDADDFLISGDESSEERSDQDPGVTNPEPGTFRLVYTGTLWNLTDIDPLVRGIEQLNSVQPELAGKLELVCVGRKTSEQQAVLNRLQKTATSVQLIDYCDHSLALKWLQSASGLCLLLSDVPGAERVVPAKMFEYLAVRKEILTIAPSGETADIVRRFFPRGHFTPDQSPAIAEWLAKRLARIESTSAGAIEFNEKDFLEYSRDSQTGKLAELLDGLVAVSKH